MSGGAGHGVVVRDGLVGVGCGEARLGRGLRGEGRGVVARVLERGDRALGKGEAHGGILVEVQLLVEQVGEVAGREGGVHEVGLVELPGRVEGEGPVVRLVEGLRVAEGGPLAAREELGKAPRLDVELVGRKALGSGRASSEGRARRVGEEGVLGGRGWGSPEGRVGVVGVVEGSGVRTVDSE